ncbi:MAG: PilN domain-containing protein, partial [Cyanobacteriota bacterium]|nr:PilN domain-containing protein [Cyanobacteriota bacterium]
MTTAPLDLLREQRRAQGLPDPVQEAQARRLLVLKGSLIGAALLAGAVVITGLLFVRQQLIRAELDRLALVEAEVQQADSRLTAARGKLKTVKDANQALVQGLVNVRSGSALLQDLQRRVPQGVQLTAVEVAPAGTSLRLLGSAADPMAFARINAFQIELGRSPLLTPTSIILAKAERGGGKAPPAGGAKVPEGLVSFELSAQFRPPLAATAELQILKELGAQG